MFCCVSALFLCVAEHLGEEPDQADMDSTAASSRNWLSADSTEDADLLEWLRAHAGSDSRRTLLKQIEELQNAPGRNEKRALARKCLGRDITRAERETLSSLKTVLWEYFRNAIREEKEGELNVTTEIVAERQTRDKTKKICNVISH